ncbi:MAG: flagellar filament capping protein FliD [Deltaproteobacteria bacterium]|nr:flagellar filament capping protein FliD [Deltaproteobacteria bacterium]
MAGTISFGGLATGLDTKKIVEQLVQLRESQLIAPVTKQINAIKQRNTALAPIKSLIVSLRDAAKALNDTANAAWNVLSGTSSDTNTVLVTATNSSTAVKGTYAVSNISALATPDRVTFTGVSDTDITTHGTGTITLTYQSTTTDITIDSTNNTLDAIKTAINDAQSDVVASIINDGQASPYRLVLTSAETGADTSITYSATGGITLAVDGALPVTPANAAFQVNGVSMTSASNTVTEAIQGMTFQLLTTETTDTINLTVKQNTSGIISNISSFVSAYNSLRSSLRTALLPDENGRLGALTKEQTLTNANVNISTIVGKFMSSVVGTGYTYGTLAQIGITMDDKGMLKVDTAKLTTALESSVTNIRYLFQGTTGENGIAEEMYNYLDLLTKPNGTFDIIDKNGTSQLLRLVNLQEDRERQVELYKNRLLQKFNNLERVVQRLKMQEGQVGSLAGIYSSSSNKLL